MDAVTGQDLRFYLQQQLVNRCRQNPRYSLRAFARFLNIESSVLSKILRGQRSISNKTFSKIASKLGFSQEEEKSWATSLKERRGRPKGSALFSSEDTNISYQQLSLDAFQVISDWYHLAILELIAVDDFQCDSQWIARALGLGNIEVKMAVERLERLGLLERAAKNRWIDRGENLSNVTPFATSQSQLQFQKQVLEKALRALDEVAVEKRDQTTMTMAIDTSLIPLAKGRIKSFRRNLCKVLQSTPCKDEVYNLSISFYPLSASKELSHE